MTNPSIKNKRLAERDREALYAFARKQITATEDRTTLDAAYDAAAVAISALVRIESPPAEMKILAKYKLADIDHCIPVSSGGGDYDQFNFKGDDHRAPMRPYSRRGCGYGSRTPILMDDATCAVHKAYASALSKSEKITKERQSDFKALIWGTTTFNALVEVWPAAEEMREKIVGSSTALSVLSNDVIDRLKADPAFAGQVPA